MEQEDKDRTIHQPEYVILDKEEDEARKDEGYAKEQADYLTTLHKIGQMKFGVGLRILCLLAAFFVALATVFIAALSLIAVAMGALTLFLSKEVNTQVLKALNNVRKLFVITFGLLIAVFSPALGLGLIVLYFMLKGESLQQDLINKVVR